MNKLFMLGLFCPLLFTASPSTAQVSPAMEAPLVWSASYQYKKELVPPKDPKMLKSFQRLQLLTGRAKQKNVYVTEDMRHEVIVWVNGRTTENWLTKGCLIFSALNFPEGVVSYVPTDEKVEVGNGEIGSKPSAGFSNSNLNFPELAWVKPETLAGEISYQGTRASYYCNPPPKKGEKPRAPSPSEGDPATPAPATDDEPKKEAWIDAKTGFPIAMEDSNVKITYKISKEKPSPAHMKMSPEFEQTWKNMKESGLFE